MAKYSNGLEDSLDLPSSAITILEKRYLKKNDKGIPIETAEDMYRRVGFDIACGDAFYLEGLKNKINNNMETPELYNAVQGDKRIQQRAKEFYTLMAEGYFLPNSPTLMNAGRDLQQLAACFVLPVPDSIEGIFEAVKQTAIVHKSGGGTGFSFSDLRPADSRVRSTGGVASGPVSFMGAFDAATEVVKQGGTRRGANMAVLSVHHPNIMDFITCKTGDAYQNFNISVGATDAFMEAAKKGENYPLIDPRDGRPVGELNAAEVYDTIATTAWEHAEPGIIFLDRMNAANPTPALGEIKATNPCGEQPLLPYESCNLGSINLGKMVTPRGTLNKKVLEQTIRKTVRFLDNVIERNRYPLPEIAEMTLGNRKIGLGVMGWADYLVKRNMGYNSSKAVKEAGKIMKFIDYISKDESQNLAKERGAFPNFDKSIYKDGPLMRNATTTTIAPTGTISIINNNASSGVETLIAIAQERNVQNSVGKTLIEINNGFREYAIRQGINDSRLFEKLAKGTKIEDLLLPTKIIDEIKRLFPTSHEVDTKWHILTQAAFQKYTDNAVSKTVNMPQNSEPSWVKEVYNMAYDTKCKGVTVYVKGSREDVLTIAGGENGGIENAVSVQNPLKIPNIVPSIKIRQQTPSGQLHVHLSIDPKLDYAPIETFGTLANAGTRAASEVESTGRLASRLLRAGAYKDPKIIIDQLKYIGSKDLALSSSGNVTSIAMGFAKALLKYELVRREHAPSEILLGKVNYDELDSKVSEIIRNEEEDSILRDSKKQNGSNLKKPSKSKKICPECYAKLNFLSGCKSGTCLECGWGKCG